MNITRHPAADDNLIRHKDRFNNLLSELAYCIGIVTMAGSSRMSKHQIGEYLTLLQFKLDAVKADSDAYVHLGQAVNRARDLEFGHARNALCALTWRVVEQFEQEDL